jgi:hypothetical protein
VLVNIFDEDVPHSATRVLGHVCGVIAAAMAVVSGYGIVGLFSALIEQRASWFGVILVLIGVALTVLFFRWAGVLTGYLKTHGKLAVPASVYAGFGVAFAALSLSGAYLASARPIAGPIVWIVGAICSAVLAHWCYVLLRNQSK